MFMKNIFEFICVIKKIIILLTIRLNLIVKSYS